MFGVDRAGSDRHTFVASSELSRPTDPRRNRDRNNDPAIVETRTQKLRPPLSNHVGRS